MSPAGSFCLIVVARYFSFLATVVLVRLARIYLFIFFVGRGGEMLRLDVARIGVAILYAIWNSYPCQIIP
jgi:hypothetical protein